MRFILSFIIIVFGTTFLCSAQETNKYYVIIGVFAVESNAQGVKDIAINSGLDAKYVLEPVQQLNYVYVYASENRSEARSKYREIRNSSPFADAWVYKGYLPETSPIKEDIVMMSPPPQPVQVNEQEVEEVEQPKLEIVYNEEDETGIPLVFALKDKGKLSQQLVGHIYAFDNEGNALSDYRANSAVRFKQPDSLQQPAYFLINAPGYEPEERDFNFDNVKTQRDAAGNYLITILMTKIKSGDYIEFNHISFLDSAALFTPQSKPELDAFISFLKENPTYSIKIHGHTNGKKHRNIVLKDEGDSFFALREGNKEKNVTATAASEYYADLARDYLIDNGIEKKRVKIKGLGGKLMLFDPDGPQAARNNRLEVQIIDR